MSAVPVVVSNCSNNYGPHHFPEKLIPLTILNALAGERLPVYGKGENVRDWLYVLDNCAAHDVSHAPRTNPPVDQSCLTIQDYGRHREPKNS